MGRRIATALIAGALLLLSGCPKPEQAADTTQAQDTPTASATAPENEAVVPSELPDVAPPTNKVPDGQAPPSLGTPEPATDFSYVALDGSKHTLSEHFGKPLVLNMWADWCGPCVSEMPDFQAVVNSRQDFKLLSITDSSSQDPHGFVKTNGYNWSFGISDEGANTYARDGWPTTYFIDAQGRIADKVLGSIDRAEFERRLATITSG